MQQKERQVVGLTLEQTENRAFYELALRLIFCHLDVRSLGRVARACGSWRHASESDDVWRKFFLSRPEKDRLHSFGMLPLKAVYHLASEKNGTLVPGRARWFHDCPYNPIRHSRPTLSNLKRLAACYLYHRDAFWAFQQRCRDYGLPPVTSQYLLPIGISLCFLSAVPVSFAWLALRYYPAQFLFPLASPQSSIGSVGLSTAILLSSTPIAYVIAGFPLSSLPALWLLWNPVRGFLEDAAPRSSLSATLGCCAGLFVILRVLWRDRKAPAPKGVVLKTFAVVFWLVVFCVIVISIACWNVAVPFYSWLLILRWTRSKLYRFYRQRLLPLLPLLDES